MLCPIPVRGEPRFKGTEIKDQGANQCPIGLSASGVRALGLHCRYRTFPEERRADGGS